eukprot:TRINITY_DN2616_c0_g1_i4.p1 TRINITY_DN2616_c0_g1~~TRINITY_DN2616_c0_g1_i4.p1  ORF type:complete len:104 (-),score=3.11 TRINITY_DN2616_c0_g1_i4:632-943(-)
MLSILIYRSTFAVDAAHLSSLIDLYLIQFQFVFHLVPSLLIYPSTFATDAAHICCLNDLYLIEFQFAFYPVLYCYAHSFNNPLIFSCSVFSLQFALIFNCWNL